MSPTNEAIVAVAAMATGRPCVLVYDYYQQITYTTKRSPFFVDLKVAADKEGETPRPRIKLAVDHGAYSEAGEFLSFRGVQVMGAGYGIPNIRGVGYVTFTNHAWGGASGPSAHPNAFLPWSLLLICLPKRWGWILSNCGTKMSIGRVIQPRPDRLPSLPLA